MPLALLYKGTTDPAFRADLRFQFFFVGYQPNWCWWEATILLRKFLLSCIRVLVEVRFPPSHTLVWKPIL